MTKSPNKFALRKETLRLLSNTELALAVGGGDSKLVQADSDLRTCVVVLLSLK